MFFRTYSPQGDGNLRFRSNSSVSRSFSEPIPRKGTETIPISLKIADITGLKFFRTYSPQGDGNFFKHSNQLFSKCHCFSEPIPRKGTETSTNPPTCVGADHVSFSEPIPRKGTETYCNLSCVGRQLITVFQNLFPARGRKRVGACIVTGDNPVRFFRTYSPQGDGNVSSFMRLRASYLDTFFRTYSPQGDGNFPYPIRRGIGRGEVFFRTYSPQGDGNLRSFNLNS